MVMVVMVLLVLKLVTYKLLLLLVLKVGDDWIMEVARDLRG